MKRDSSVIHQTDVKSLKVEVAREIESNNNGEPTTLYENFSSRSFSRYNRKLPENWVAYHKTIFFKKEEKT